MIPTELLIFAGRGDYPQYVLDGARKAGVKTIHILGVRGMASKKLLKQADNYKVFGIGELENALKWVESLSSVKHIILAGQITPIALFRTRFDAYTRRLLSELPVKNAHTIFSSAIRELEKCGKTVIPSSCFMGAHIPGEGLLTERPLTDRERSDINFGHQVAMGVCDLDIGQTILVKDGMILAVEAFEGTNKTLRRGAKLGGKGSVMVKVAKNGHDMRFDIPVFGEHTLKLCKKHHITTVAFQANRLVMINRDKVIDLANRWGIALIGLNANLPNAPLEPEA